MSRKRKNSFGSLILVLAVAAAAFLGGRISAKLSSASLNEEKGKGKIVTYSPPKQPVPKAQFFVMSFCPYGNQAETSLKPVADLLKNSDLEWEPRYILNKITLAALTARCEQRVYSADRCRDYLEKGYFPDQKSCQEQLYSSLQECKDDQGFIVGADVYTSLHGIAELRQNLREICVWQQEKEDKGRWWDFVERVNENCTLANIDECWQEQAESGGLAVAEIENCLKNQAADILQKEIETTEKYQVSGSPTFIFNGERFPPEGAYPTAEGEVVNLKIGKEVFTPEQYRSPETLKRAICAGWEKPPAECEEKLEEITSNSGGGC